MQIGVKMRGGIDGEKMQAHLTAAGDQLLEQLHPRIDLLASRLMSGNFFKARKDNQLFDETGEEEWKRIIK